MLINSQIVECTIADLPLATAASKNTFYRITDLGTGSALFYSNGSYWIPCGEQLIYVNNIGATLTGTTTETVLSTFTFPSKLASPNMTIVASSLWSTTNNANNKTLRARLNGTSGTEFLSVAISTSTSFQTETMIRHRNSVASQIGMSAGTTTQYGLSGNAVVTSNIDMSSANRDIVLTGQLANSSDSIILRAYTISLRA